MLVSASTVKDSPANLRRFVDRNLGAGLDHMVLFLDDALPEAEELFAGSPHVTCVRAAGEEWWGDAPVPGLNARQNINASLVNLALARAGWASWLFHLDADEVVRIDRSRLLRLDPSVRAVRLEVLEAVSHEDAEAEGGWFKLLLPRPDRELLLERGLIRGLANNAYFHGHVAGKSAWRPDLDLRAGIHKPVDRAGRKVRGLEAAWLQVLHLDAVAVADFARKWRAFSRAGVETMRFRAERAVLAESVLRVLAQGLSTEDEDRALHRIWSESVRDPFPQLRDLGYLVRVDTDERAHRPRAPAAPDLARLREVLSASVGADRTALLRGEPETVLAHLARILGES